ncbi:serine/threonine protein kinase [Magnaporthiopsis poae ATCC 64411]|uniref:Serine/threonine protein kinase n=1 Tax=Magnaporthiopsis poae (strain ATCC 64411 / 73-15) TaxID=644358 RepID=A0A0C4EG71_MAGP6|nr:serine/threonine protein kinase [Magnaporthiopsis poae ATCC 64411]
MTSQIAVPILSSIADVVIQEAWTTPSLTGPPDTTWKYITPDDRVFHGEVAGKAKEKLSLTDIQSGLLRFQTTTSFLGYDTPEGGLKPAYNVLKDVLDEASVMERISKGPRGPHPYIVTYYGCRVRRGRIAGLVLEKHDWTLREFVKDRAEDFAKMNREAFLAGVQSAVLFLHSLELAHNDITPSNIMVSKAGEPILIDFGSCGLYGADLQSLGSPGWCKEVFYTSERDHDGFSLGKLKEWLEEQQKEAKTKIEEMQKKEGEGKTQASASNV